MDLSSGTIQWNISFIWLIHDWEVDTLASFYSLLYSFRSRREREDKLWWTPSHKGIFDIRSFYKTIAFKDNPSFPQKSIWRTKAPSKVAFFVWSASLGKILTLDNLRRRQIIMVNRCCLCKLDGESVDHLLLHCVVARSLWNTILSRFGLSRVMPNKVVDLMACWWYGGNSRSVVVWKMMPLCLMWCVWRERNDRNFDNLERTLEEIKSFFFYSLFTWTFAYLALIVISFSNFLALFSSQFQVFSCILLMYQGCAPLRFLLYTTLLIKK